MPVLATILVLALILLGPRRAPPSLGSPIQTESEAKIRRPGLDALDWPHTLESMVIAMELFVLYCMSNGGRLPG